jgi:DNA-binding CsgD family transcriptional regulator
MLRKKQRRASSPGVTFGCSRLQTTGRFLELIRELYECESPPALCRQATQQLARLIPCEVASFNAIDLSQLTVAATDVPEGTCTEQMRAILATHLQGHPLIATLMQLREPTALRLSDVISQNRFAQTAVASDFYRPIGLAHAQSLVGKGECARGLVVMVSCDRRGRDFSDRESALLQGLMPHIIRAYAISRRLAAIETCATMLARLTPREADILKLLADGATNDGVARELAISPRTVQTHLDRLYRKLGVANRTGAVAMYLNYDATGARAPTSIGVAGSKPHSAQDPS